MKVKTIVSKQDWKPPLSYEDLKKIVADRGGQELFIATFMEMCLKGTATILGEKGERYRLQCGQFSVILRAKMPPNAQGLTLTKPLDIFIAMPEHPEDPEAWGNAVWKWRFVSEARFDEWVRTCTQL